MATAHDIIQMFGSVEDDQKYTRLVELFTDDAIYCDPFAGPQRGRSAIAGFMGEMERRLPKMGVYFADWQTVAGTSVGWSKWSMVVPVGGVEHPIAGQSVYRLRDGLVCYVSDYVDSTAYRAIRADVSPDHMSAAHEMKGVTDRGAHEDLLRHSWRAPVESTFGAKSSMFDLIDCAADDSVAWVQWTTSVGGASFPGWSLHTIDGVTLTTDSVYCDF